MKTSPALQLTINIENWWAAFEASSKGEDPRFRSKVGGCT
jgi:hypothetical protein